jgi:circadian clock protein KaiC
MNQTSDSKRILSGVRNLDEVLHGGFPIGELTVFAGSPGAGKTTLAEQVIFKNATPEHPAVIFQTLSEPTAKTLGYLQQFSFFDPLKLEDGSITFVDLGDILRAKGLEQAIELLMNHIRKVRPAFVVIDSFKVFEDLSNGREELRKFSYEIAVNLMAWECTAFFLGEFSDNDIATNPLFSIIDGIVTLRVRLESGEYQRFIQVLKMRGTDHSRDEHTFDINSSGIEIYAPRVTIKRRAGGDQMTTAQRPKRAKLGIKNIDELLGEGISYGSTCLVSGVAGTGKTLLLLEFIYRGATEFGEKGLFFSFEETEDRIIANAKGMGWKIEEEIKKGNIEVVYVPLPEIQVERHLLMIKDRIDALGAKRIAIDSVSVFVHKILEPQVVREKIYQLSTLVQMSQALGLFSTDLPYGTNKISRFGVEETVVDGIIILSAVNDEKTLKRNRSLEIYKLRNTAHANGRHVLTISGNGLVVTPSGPKRGPLRKKLAKKSKWKK